jgi:hypothetical protein
VPNGALLNADATVNVIAGDTSLTVAPSIGVVMKRDREAELIFRGRQYARAVGLFQRRYGRYPNQLKELYENRPRTIRHLWKDPMCNCDFQPLIQGMPCGPIGVGQPPGAPPPGNSPICGAFPDADSAKTAFLALPPASRSSARSWRAGPRCTKRVSRSGAAKFTTSGASSWATPTGTLSGISRGRVSRSSPSFQRHVNNCSVRL